MRRGYREQTVEGQENVLGTGSSCGVSSHKQTQHDIGKPWSRASENKHKTKSKIKKPQYSIYIDVSSL